MKTGPIVFVSGGEGGGGVLSLVRDLAPAVAMRLQLPVLHLGLRSLPIRPSWAPDNFSVECLTAGGQEWDVGTLRAACVKRVVEVNAAAVLLNDVSELNGAWQYLRAQAQVIAVLHDEGRRYRRPIAEGKDHLDGVVVVAEYLGRLLVRDAPCLYPKLHVVYNGIRFPPDLEPAPRLPMDGRPVRILYVGDLDTFKKGTQDIPKLSRCLKELGVEHRMVVVGGTEERRRFVFDRFGLTECLEWYARKQRDEMLLVANQCDFFFLPSRIEPFGLVTVETMGMGCIPLAYDIETGTKEIIEDGKSGALLPLGDIRAAAFRISGLISDPERLIQMHQAAIARARTRFSIERAAAGYAAVIEYVLEKETSAIESISRAKTSYGRRKAPKVGRGKMEKLSARVRGCIRTFIGNFPRLTRFIWRHFA